MVVLVFRDWAYKPVEILDLGESPYCLYTYIRHPVYSSIGHFQAKDQ